MRALSKASPSEPTYRLVHPGWRRESIISEASLHSGCLYAIIPASSLGHVTILDMKLVHNETTILL